MEKNWRERQKLMALASAVKTLEILLSVALTEWFERLLAQFYEYESWMAIGLMGCLTVVTYFMYIWLNRAIDVKTFELSQRSTTNAVPLVDSSLIKLSVSASVMSQLVCLAASETLTRLMYRQFDLKDQIVMWVSTVVVVFLAFLWGRVSSEYEKKSQLMPIIEDSKARIIMMQQ